MLTVTFTYHVERHFSDRFEVCNLKKLVKMLRDASKIPMHKDYNP